MKAIHVKTGKIIEYHGELHVTPDIEREVEILQSNYSFWGGGKAICKVSGSFEIIPLKELKSIGYKEIENELKNETPHEFHSIDDIRDSPAG